MGCGLWVGVSGGTGGGMSQVCTLHKTIKINK